MSADFQEQVADIILLHRMERHSVSNAEGLIWWGHCIGCEYETKAWHRNFAGWEEDLREAEANHLAGLIAAVSRD